MNLTTQQENEILQVYHAYWDNYIKGDVEAMHPLLADEYTQVGSAESEVFFNKKDAVQFLYDTIEQVAGKLEMRNRKTTLEQKENSILIHEFCDLYALADGNWIFYSKFRASSLMQQKNDSWKIIHQHSSFPDTKTEDGQNISIGKVAEENLQLREAIKRRTVELEQKNRELEIETSLERVRAEAMGMKKPDDILAICKVMFTELQSLGFPQLRNTLINFWDDERSSLIDYDYSDETGGHKAILSYSSHPVFEQFQQKIKNSQDAFAELVVTKDELESWKQRRRDSGEYEDPRLNYIDALYYYFYSIGVGAIGISTFKSIPDDQLNILKRFRNVFDFAYRRYADVAQAEAQTREAEIQLALERVRARSMAMHKSEELAELSLELVKQVQALGVATWFCAFNINDEDPNSSLEWGSNGRGTFPQYRTPREGVFLRYYQASQRGENLFINEIGENECPAHYEYLCSLPGVGDQLLQMKNAGIPFPSSQIDHVAFFKYGYLLFITYEPVPEAHEIFIRFAKVFEQTYTRFLDLQKAEAQAKEAQIEAALERVRSRSMAMHKSDELLEAGEILFLEMQKLGIESLTAGYVLIDKEEENGFNYTPHPGTKKIMPVPVIIPHNETIHMQQVVENWKKGNSFFIVEMDENETIKHQTFIAERSTNFPLSAAELIAISPAKLFLHNFYFKEGYILIVGGTKLSVDQTDIMLRFAKVFQQTYTRFLDLQKAEAQTREAKIEAALEKARSRTMGMQSSDELPEVANILFLEVQGLGIPAWSCGYNILAEDKTSATCCMSSEGTLQTPFKLRLFGEASFAEMGDFIRSEQTMLVQELGGNALEEHYAYMKSFPDLKSTFDQIDELGLSLPTYQINHLCKFTQGFLLFITYEKVPDSHDIFKRFTKVFEQTYTRFLDLKKAESQARQAKIETALEKVRARALAMQEPEELTEVAKVLRHEMGLLGVEELETCSIFIHDETINRTECWYALKDSRSEENKLVSDHFPLQLHDTWVGREMKKFYSSDSKQVSIVMQGANRKEWINYCEEKSISLQGYYGENIPDRTYHLYKFSHGAIGAASAGDISSESWDLLQRAASVFSLAYSRFKDLTQARFDLQRLKEEKQKAETALSELQTTQKQLIQSEKMASLGELTAGIAHEIQNPLNFVNNFSDVSTELIDEMNEEIAKGNLEDAKQIAEDLKQNLEKINHHGKRAGDIVKGMLQHSRSSSATKEPTNVNKLADEYLRLAYHGLRAKDKSFNATLKTDFDETIGNINIIPQDIGRVILNLITNAFYVVNEKSKQGIAGYEPTVSVSTKKANSKIEISVKDNGKGIPDSIKEKIFQPFFTTKPTGQGTGLGLSLSYDIVKAHGGEMKVETKEGEGSEFIIQIPIV